ncbi:MAG: ADOP family duplicated permease [Gemmatimonadales bacterium]
MRIWHMLRYFLRSLFRGRSMDAELDAELRDHVARDAAARTAAGADPGEAHRLASVALGGVTRHAESARDARGWRWARDAGTDIRHAVRLLRRYPGFAVATIGITALGIAATTVVFSAVNGVLLRPLPFPKPDQLAMVMLTNANAEDGFFSGPTVDFYPELRQQPAVMAAGVYGMGSSVISKHGEPQMASLEYLTPSALALLGRTPILGRVFTDDDADRDAPVIVLSHVTWLQRFGGDSSAIGRTIVIDGRSLTVIGIMPADFRGPRLLGPAGWLPARISHGTVFVNGAPKRGGTILVRLRDGLSAAAASQLLSARIHPRIFDPFSRDSTAGRVRVERLGDVVILDSREPLEILGGAVAFVLLLVAVNVSALTLARAAQREHEMAVRRALGAGRSRRIRQSTVEVLFLMAIGGTIGVALARVGVMLFVNAGVDILPRLGDIRLDRGVLGVAAGLTLLAALLAASVPAVSIWRGDAEPFRGMTASPGTRRGRLRAALVAVEIALSVILLIGAGLLMKGFVRVAPTAPGFAIDHRAAISVSLVDSLGTHDDSAAAHLAFVRRVEERFRQVRGVVDVAATSILPLTGTSVMYPVTPDGKPVHGYGHQRAVTPNYLALMRMPVLAGRGLEGADGVGAPAVTVVNQTAAAHWWPGTNPVGHTLSWGQGNDRHSATVVGIVRDARVFGTDTTHATEFYVPYAQAPWRMLTFVVETSGDPGAVIPDLKRELWSVAPGLPIQNAMTLSQLTSDAVKSARLYTVMMAVFAAMALVLAAAGIFSVVAFAVAERRREIAIRLALGSPPARLGGLVIRQSAVVAGCGIAAGILAARLLTKYMESILVAVTPTDTGVFVATAVGLAVVVVVACAIPVRRALATDPLAAMRVE